MLREVLLVLVLVSPLAALDQGGQLSDLQAPQALAPSDKDLRSYLKDVEAKTDADCVPTILAVLKTNDPAAHTKKLELARQRKAEVLKAYEFLRAQPAPEATRPVGALGNGDAGRRDHFQQPAAAQPNPAQLQPPINERTFPAWIGPEVKDLKEVYTRWLQERNQEFHRELENPVSLERRKEIDAALAANQLKIAELGRIKDTAELSCFLGEFCGPWRELSDPVGVGGAIGGGAWTKTNYERANQDEAKRQTRTPGGKIDRGVPSLGAIATDVAENSPLGPLVNKPEGKGAGLKTAATVALATTGALLLFGGLGGKMLEEKYPDIRRDMGLAAGVSGVLAAGALSLPTLIPSLSASPQVAGGAGTIIAASKTPGGQRLLVHAEQQIPQSVAQGARLKEHLRLLEEYGEAGKRSKMVRYVTTVS